MSEAGSKASRSGEDSDEAPPLFRCKLCPGSEFTAVERDMHRSQHTAEEIKAAKAKRRRERDGEGSTITLFNAIESPSEWDASPEETPKKTIRQNTDPSDRVTSKKVHGSKNGD